MIEWTLESRGGKTILRLVQSGFSTGAAWEDEWFESTDYGWGFMLLGLRWALERHRGVPRQTRWLRRKVQLPREETQARIERAGAIFETSIAGLQPGESYSLKTTTGEAWSGRVEFSKPLRGFCLSVRELSDALLWVTIEGSPEKIDAQIWLSAFGVDEGKLNAFEEKWSQRWFEILS